MIHLKNGTQQIPTDATCQSLNTGTLAGSFCDILAATKLKFNTLPHK